MNIETALIDLAPATKRAITRFDKAAQEYAVIGSQHPVDQEAIGIEYTRSRECLENAIKQEIKKAGSQ